MNFQDQLATILKSVPGAQSAILMGFDGIPVAEAKTTSESPSIAEPTIEFGQLLQEAGKIAQGNNFGALHELTLQTDKARFLFRYVDASYFVAILLSDSGNVGKGRYALRRSAPEIKREL